MKETGIALDQFLSKHTYIDGICICVCVSVCVCVAYIYLFITQIKRSCAHYLGTFLKYRTSNYKFELCGILFNNLHAN